jgi:hypothetical protein
MLRKGNAVEPKLDGAAHGLLGICVIIPAVPGVDMKIDLGLHCL